MSQTIPISDNITTLNQVQASFNIRRTNDDHFFTEWFDSLPEINNQEKESLDQLKHKYLYQRADGPLPEGTVKMVILSPLLDLAGFYESPFRFRTETPVEIAIKDRDEILRGRIDALVIQQFWILVIESKRTTFDVELAIPQALTYMMANPYPDKPVFGMVTNGGSLVFIKLIQQGSPKYDLSDVFSLLPRRNKLYDVLRVLKRIDQLSAQA